LESNELSAISGAQSSMAPGFKRFQNNNNDDDETNFNGHYVDPSGINNQQQQHIKQVPLSYQGSKPDSAAFQNMQKYPKKQSKNPYKDTHNLIDNMDEDDY
jgi:hypothetical protein